MASSVWSALEGAGMSGGGGSSSSAFGGGGHHAADPAALLNSQLASALTMTGDAQYWEESISPATIRQSLADAMPSDAAQTKTLLRGMKWLLAAISKGRNVSDFYPHVVKLVGAVSLEVRKMVYMYLVQYADYDATTRELSLLSINSFQRGLADSEPLIRALALRVLTSIRLNDILQIQMLGVQKCSKDRSPYVRKCAANALAKLYPRCSSMQQQQALLLEILVDLLETDQATMVLTSALVTLQETCPYRLDFLHASFRKICHLLTDMDEWGQVVVIDMLARYCRTFFAQPAAWKDGTAERIDKERRVRRTIHGIETSTSNTNTTNNDISSSLTTAAAAAAAAPPDYFGQLNTGGTPMPTLPPHPPGTSGASTSGAFKDHTAAHGGGGGKASGQKVKRRVVKKGFYSDEEDESTEEDVYVGADGISRTGGQQHHRNVLGLPPSATSGVLAAAATNAAAAVSNGDGNVGNINNNNPHPHHHHDDDEDVELAPDHRLVLNSAMPLLKSRNSGVVLAVCSLLYYCGVSSVKVRTAMGKALVRIHRGDDDGREIQYVVLASIRTLVTECPSALSPFLHDFYVKAMDPPFTRLIKLDILTALALDPTSIRAVLQELRLYVRESDLAFGMAAIRAVGRVVELARIVHDRHGQKESRSKNQNNNSGLQERAEANQVALNALHGLLTLTQVSGSRGAVGQAVIVMQQILQLLQSDAGDHGDLMNVHDPNKVQYKSMKRIIILLIHTLSSHRTANEDETEHDNDGSGGGDDDNHEQQVSALEKVAMELLPSATASALWIVGELLASVSPNTIMFGTKLDVKQQCRIRLELVRLLVKSFPELHAVEKEQAIRLASKMLVSKAVATATAVVMSSLSFSPEEGPLCEQLLAMGRVDVNPQVRDGARSDSGILRLTIGLQHDTDALDDISPPLVGEKLLTLDSVKRMLLQGKPASSSLPVEDHTNTHDTESKGFRFGTLSSIVGHRARNAYVPLPPWADKDSPSELRTPSTDRKPQLNDSHATAASGGGDGWATKSPSGAPTGAGGLYDDSSTDNDDSSSSSSSSSSSGDDDDESSSSDSSSSEASNEDADNESSESSEGEDDSSGSGEEEGQQISRPPSRASAGGGGGGFSKQTVPIIQVEDVSRMESSEGSENYGGIESGAGIGDYDSSSMEGAASLNVGSLIPMTNQTLAMTAAAPVQPANGSLADDFKGMVLAPVIANVDDDETQQDPNVGRDSSSWFQLVRPEHAGGLAVTARYVRGLTKAREAQLMGLTADKPSLVVIQIRFENKKTNAAAGGSSSFRHLRIVQRSSTTSGSMIGPRKVVPPQEIDVLHVGQRSDCMLGIEFASPSDRDGSLLAKFDIKFGSSGSPVEIKPAIADVLLPCQRSLEEFDEQVKRLQGFQRVDTNLAIDSSKLDQLPAVMMLCAALTPVGQKLGFQGDKLRLAGTLPASSNPVYVLVSTLAGKCKLSVCSDDAMAANSVMSVLKRNIQERLK